MTTSSRQTVEAFLTGLRLRDIGGALSCVRDDAVVTVFPTRVIDGGRADLADLLTDIARAFPDLLLTVSHIVEVGQVVVAEFKLEGTQAADFLGAINQEKHLDIDTAWRFTVVDDRISAIEAYWCQNQLYRRLAVKRQDHVTIV
ncbi:nuclear transport factor 2 family protein [Rudaeicoccus suwonensis]|uniref:Ketosteroid isomerase-like protein n=1 Tax=Rudaeicoccus suwonensis TaxID=657409 RepID=A0A561E2Y6_9MICO|nr:nuclear transport factor 2 family protein [Rudaeicoccus suwonensis]TWE09977.1 ketosteroid isomerase-like protein [Rudaeicoccus suwonensis]